MTQREDLYIVLEVRRTASVSEIKKAFRRLARRFHPDINPGNRRAEERFKIISEAYEILSDPQKRTFYDENGFYTAGVLESQRPEDEWAFSFQGFDFASSAPSAFGEIFGQFVAGQASRRQAEKGRDLEYQVSLSFEDAIRGVSTGISVLRKNPCGSCAGTGRSSGTGDVVCGACNGAGKSLVSKGRLQFAVTCSRCSGSGRRMKPCPDCGGDGRVAQHQTLDVAIPSGVNTGSRIRLAGLGDVGPRNGAPGDLYIVTNVAPHPFFKRMGDNIHCVVSISLTEAALGAKIEVPTIDGRAVVRVPPGTQSHQMFRLREKGAPSLLDASMRGDQYVEVRVVVPRVADERSKEILRELAKLNPEDPRKELWK